MKKYLDQDGTKHLVRKLDEKIKNTVKNATSTEAGLVKVEGTSGESAPYTVYSKGKIDELEKTIYSDLNTSVGELDQSFDEELENYQPKLTAGDNIKIEGNTISYDDTKLREEISKKYVTTEKLDIGRDIPDVARLNAKAIVLNTKNRGLVRVLTVDDIKIVQGNMGNSAIINADVVLTTDRKTQNQYRLLSEKDTGSGSGLDADKLDGYHADQFFRKNNDIYQIKGRFNARINSNLSSIKWVTIDDIFFYDISFAVIGDPTEINNGLAPIASLQFRRPLSRTTYLDAISPAGVLPKQFEVRSNGEIYLNKNLNRSIQPKIPYLLKGIGTSV